VPVSELRLVKRSAQWLEKEDRKLIQKGVRGIYALHKERYVLNKQHRRVKKYDVVYIGMTTTGSGLRARLDRHARSTKKDWTHFSMFVVWENIRDEEIGEMEGLFREIYRKDKRANKFNKQGKFKKIQNVRLRPGELKEILVRDLQEEEKV
jgi:hypothetical protein